MGKGKEGKDSDEEEEVVGDDPENSGIVVEQSAAEK